MAIRQFHQEYLKNPSYDKVEILFRVVTSLATQASIADHRAKGLEEALQLEKKKRQRSKKLGLNGKDVVEAQLFGVDEIQEAREFQARKEADILDEKEAKALAKATKALEKETKALEKEAKALERKANQVAKKEKTIQD